MLKYLPKDTLAQWAVGSVAVAGAASVAYVLVFPSDSPDPAPEAPRVVMTEPGESALPQDEPAPEVQFAMASPLAEMAPKFDIVRVTDTGDVLIAGKAPATSAVAALIDEESVAQTISTAAGEFVLMFGVDPSPAPRVLELEVRLPNGDRLRSVDTLMLAPRSDLLAASAGSGASGEPVQMARPVEVAPLFPNGDAPAAPQVGEPDTDAQSAPEAGTQARAPTGTAQQGSARAQSSPLAMLLRADGSVQMLGEAPRLPQLGSSVSIDSVVYDDEGEVGLSGRSTRADAEVLIYLDNQPILRARAEADGNWQAQLAGIDRGVYRLRVDEVDDAAQVISRAEIPFERVTPEIARESRGPQALTVQPGNTLWGMSTQKFGDGRRYMRIFEANRDQIRNPDLIYPGQIFVIPEAAD